MKYEDQTEQQSSNPLLQEEIYNNVFSKFSPSKKLNTLDEDLQEPIDYDQMMKMPQAKRILYRMRKNNQTMLKQSIDSDTKDETHDHDGYKGNK